MRPPLSAQTLLDTRDTLWLPYDKARRALPDAGFSLLSCHTQVFNADLQPFRLDYRGLRQVLVINGMGVALGDSIIGLSALHWLLAQHPALHFTLWRGCTVPASVEEAYAHAAARIHVEYLPQPRARLAGFDAVIDLADFMYRPAFDALPMIDFFFESLGIDAASVPAAAKTNAWLRTALPAAAPEGDYVLFCPHASTALRAIPEAAHGELIEALWQRFRRPVLGFSRAQHPAFTDVSAHSPSLTAFMQLIARARHVLTADSAALHLAAGLGTPSTAFFTSIRPALRCRDYPQCTAIHLDTRGRLAGLHASDDNALLAHARSLWQDAGAHLAAAHA